MKTDSEVMFQALITAGWANGSTGEVESPTGHVATIDLHSEREMMAEVLEEPHLREALEATQPGWYVVIEDSQGNVSIEGPMDEDAARKKLVQADWDYGVWLG